MMILIVFEQLKNIKNMEVNKMEITTKQMNEAAQAGLTVFVIINGEYHEYRPETSNNDKQEETV